MSFWREHNRNCGANRDTSDRLHVRISCIESAQDSVKKQNLADDFYRDLDFNYHFTNKISRVGFVCLAVIRLEAPGLNFLLSKPAFTKGSMAIMAFEQMSTSPHGFVAGRVIQWLKCQLLSLLHLDHY